jgi:hypothetical protein
MSKDRWPLPSIDASSWQDSSKRKRGPRWQVWRLLAENAAHALEKVSLP